MRFASQLTRTFSPLQSASAKTAHLKGKYICVNESINEINSKLCFVFVGYTEDGYESMFQVSSTDTNELI